MKNALKKLAFVSSAVDNLEPRAKDPSGANRRYFIIGERRISNYWWASVIFLGGFGFLLTGISSYINYNILASVFSIIEGVSVNITHGFDHLPVISHVVTEVGTAASLPALAQEGMGISPIPIPFGEGDGTSSIGKLAPLGILFFPQGLLMCFYGSLGVLLSLYWWLLIYWNVGGGFNEFNKKEGFMRIFRWGYPGKNRRIDLVYSLKDIEAIRVEFKQSQGLLAPEQTIYVRLLTTPSVEQLKDQTFPLKKEAPIPVSFKEKREIPLGGIGQPLTLKEIEKQASDLANYLQVTLEGL